MIKTALAALAVLVVVVACNKPGPGRLGTAPSPAVSTPIARQEAARLLGRGDWAAAETQYRVALQNEPDDVTLHYGLGTALSHLDRGDDTRKEFEWVVAHAQRGREEFTGARQWLSQLAPSTEASTEPVTAPASATTAAPTAPEAKPLGSVKGKTVWPGITPESRPTSLELRLTPEDGGAPGRPLKLHIRLGSSYTFPKIPAGAYELVAGAEGRELWKRRVVITADTEAVVDLTPDTSVLTPAEFPPRNSS